MVFVIQCVAFLILTGTNSQTNSIPLPIYRLYIHFLKFTDRPTWCLFAHLSLPNQYNITQFEDIKIYQKGNLHFFWLTLNYLHFYCIALIDNNSCKYTSAILFIRKKNENIALTLVLTFWISLWSNFSTRDRKDVPRKSVLIVLRFWPKIKYNDRTSFTLQFNWHFLWWKCFHTATFATTIKTVLQQDFDK